MIKLNIHEITIINPGEDENAPDNEVEPFFSRRSLYLG